MSGWKLGSVWLVSPCRQTLLKIPRSLWEGSDLASSLLSSRCRQANQLFKHHQWQSNPWLRRLSVTFPSPPLPMWWLDPTLMLGTWILSWNPGWSMLVFRNIYFKNRVVQPGFGKGFRCPASAPTNASTFHIAITDNQTNEPWFITQVDGITGAVFYQMSLPGCHL